jgi:hypothetical protein
MSATSEAAALQQNNLQLLRKPFRAQELYNAVNTTLVVSSVSGTLDRYLENGEMPLGSSG